MEIKDFIEKFEEQYDDITPGTIAAETEFRSVDGWSSLTALMVLSMIDEEYGVTVTGDDMRQCQTVQQLFDLVNSRL